VSEHRKLDFVVLGIARSGTTAVVRAINNDPECFCSNEYFREHFKLDYRTVVSPDAFFDSSYASRDEKNARNIQATLREKLRAGNLIAIGDKQPRYFLHMARLHAELPALRSIHIHRPPAEMADSWDRRARNEKDTWPAGRVGYYGILEWLISLARLAELHTNSRLIDYRAMFFHDPQVYIRTMEFISGREPDDATLGRFVRGEFRGTSGLRPASATRYDTLLSSIDSARMDALSGANAFCGIDTVRAPVQAFVEAAWDTLFAGVTAALADAGTAAERRFAFGWSTTIAAHFDDATSATFTRLWPHLLDLVMAMVPFAEEQDHAGLHRLVRVLTRRLGSREPLRPLLRVMRAANVVSAA